MQLLQIELALARAAPVMPFYGGVLHGMVDQPFLSKALPPRTAMRLLPPPVSYLAQESELHFGI